MPGPWITAAFICEKVLQEPDGVISAIRIVDRITNRATGAEVPSEMPPTEIALTVVIMLKSDEARGRHTVGLRPERPSGEQMDTFNVPVHFEGGDRGVNVILPTQITATMEGLHWFDVLLDDRVITRIPLSLLYQPLQTGGSAGEL